MTKKANEEYFDLEHMILRLPDYIADSLNKDLSDGIKLENKLSIKFNKESRQCQIRYDNNDLNGVIVNIPNEACTMKTADNDKFTNLLPVKHMILAEDNPSRKTKYNKDLTLKDGITPPLKNINILKYRKPKKTQSVKMMKIIKEMLIADSKAESVWYKMTDESDDEETDLRDIEYIRTECDRIEAAKLAEKEAKRQILSKGKCNSSSDEDNANYSGDSASSSSEDSDISLTEDDDDADEDDLSTDDNDFEDF